MAHDGNLPAAITPLHASSCWSNPSAALLQQFCSWGKDCCNRALGTPHQNRGASLFSQKDGMMSARSSLADTNILAALLTGSAPRAMKPAS